LSEEAAQAEASAARLARSAAEDPAGARIAPKELAPKEPCAGAPKATGGMKIRVPSLWERLRDETGSIFPRRGSTANLSRGTTLPRTIREQMAVEEAAANPTAGRQLPITMTDARWPASQGWVKMEQVIDSGGGQTRIHYVYNTITGEVDDFKIV